MAILTASKAFDITNVIDINATSINETATKIIAADNSNNSFVITGSGLSWNYADSGPLGAVSGVEFKTAGTTLYKITGSFWDETFNGYDEGYDLGSSIGTLYGMTAEVAWWLRGNDTVNGSSGNDKLRGYNGNDTVNGNAGNDMVAGNAGSDKLYGGDGDDLLKGGGGTNLVDGGAGIDTSSYDWMTTGAKVSLAVATAQLVATGGPTDTIVGIENLTGSAYADTLTGNAVANKLAGSGGNDVLNGGAGNDILVGGSGIDALTGGVGKDAFVFESALNAGTNVDTIKDFVAVDDTIKLENAVFKKLTLAGALNAANFKASATGNAADSNDFVLYETDTGKLFYDLDGSGAGAKVLFAVLGTSTHPAITAADFAVI
jgi:Ca2+-binding RTX toxin-like protein